MDTNTVKTAVDKLPSDYESTIADHHKSLLEIAKDIENKSKLIKQESIKMNHLIDFFEKAIYNESIITDKSED